MGRPAEKLGLPPCRATLADLEAVPPPQVAELIRGVLYTFPRPAPKHARAASRLGRHLGPFDDDPGEPGGWVILDEPELHFPDPSAPGESDAVAPDLAGWRRERLPELPETAYFTLAPDWICEVLSPSTAALDRAEKMPLYAREGVRHVWLIDPIARTLEVFSLEGGRWVLVAVHRDAVRVRAEPFDAIELDLSVLWTK
jgi:Uma2 family endonuclease